MGSVPLLFPLHQVTNCTTVIPTVVSITDDIIFYLFLAFSKWHLHVVITIIFIMPSIYEHALPEKICYQQGLFSQSAFFSLPMPPYHLMNEVQFRFSPLHTHVKDSSVEQKAHRLLSQSRSACDSQHHCLQLRTYGQLLNFSEMMIFSSAKGIAMPVLQCLHIRSNTSTQ